MIFTRRLREGVRRGRIRCTIRIWKGLHVKVGGRYRMDEGHVVVDSIAPIGLKDVTDDLARESGFRDAEDLLETAQHGGGDDVYLIRFHYLPPGGWERASMLVQQQQQPPPAGRIRPLLTGGDRRSIAKSNRVRRLVECDPALVAELVALTRDSDWLVVQRAIDLLEKLAHDHVEWIAPHRRVFLGPLARSDKWEIRLQIVRALPLFRWTPAERRRAVAILAENVSFPQTFVRAWALDGLARLTANDPAARPTVLRHLRTFERSSSKALQARARQIRAWLATREEIER